MGAGDRSSWTRITQWLRQRDAESPGHCHGESPGHRRGYGPGFRRISGEGDVKAAVARFIILVCLSAGVAGCARPPAYSTYTSEERKFSITYPQGWEIIRNAGDERVWFVPLGSVSEGETPHVATSEFLLVFTVTLPGPLTDDEARRVGLTLLSIHGVSGFRRFKEEAGAVWHRFEVTGTSRRTEWASVGVLVTGRTALQYVVCAKSLDRWRQGQKQCDEILKTFRPGTL